MRAHQAFVSLVGLSLAMLSADDLFEQIDEAYLKVLNELEIADPQPGGVGVAPGAPETSDKPEVEVVIRGQPGAAEGLPTAAAAAAAVGNDKATTSSSEYHPSAASSSVAVPAHAPDPFLTTLGDPDAVQTPSKKAVRCLICKMWLNGQTQFEDHIIGKTHKGNLRKHQGGNGITKLDLSKSLDTPDVVEVAERCTPLALGAEHPQDDQEAAYGIDCGQRLTDGQYVAQGRWPAVEQWLAEGQWLPGQWLAEPQPPHDYRGWQPGIWQIWQECSWQPGIWQEYSWQDDSKQWNSMK